jgi:hypothetical protein
MKEIRRAATALKAQQKKGIKYHTKEPQFAVVRRVEPELSVEVTGSRLVLDEDDLHLSQDVRRYENDYGLKVGDTVMVTPIGEGDYAVTDVVSEKKDFEGSDTNAVMGSGFIGGGSDSVTIPSGGGSDTVTIQGTPIVGTVPFYDKDGKVIGRIPLLAP